MRGLLSFLGGCVLVLFLASAMELANAAGVWECPSGDHVVLLDAGTGYYGAHCVTAGIWQEHNPEFDPASLDPAVATSALGAGFIVMGIGVLMARAVRIIIDMVRSA